MSIDRWTYVGPWLEVTSKPEYPIGEIVFEELDESFMLVEDMSSSSDTRHRLIFNGKRGMSREYLHDDGHWEICQPLGSNAIKEECERFLDAITTKEWDAIQGGSGYVESKVRWGVLKWCT